MSLAKVTGSYQVSIPVKLRRKFKIKLGDFLEVVETEEGILYKPKRAKGAVGQMTAHEIKEYWRKRIEEEEGEVELSEETWKKVERSIKQIEKGHAKTFNNVEELIRELKKK